VTEGAREWARRLDTVGVWTFDVERLPASAAREYARTVESLGFPALWIPESLGSKEAFAHASLLLSATTKLVVATGIANIWARDPIAMANGARTLVDAYPDRFLLGVGVSHAPVVKTRGQSYTRPLEYMRRYLDAMDAAPYVGPAVDVPRVVAALGPQMLRLSAERSLGAHPYFVPVEHTQQARQTLGPDPLLAVEQAVVFETDAGRAREIARTYTRRYLAAENYANNLRRLGWAEADLSPSQGGSDRLVDAVVAWGDTDQVAPRLKQHFEAGADHVCVQVLTAEPSALAVIEQLRRLAPLDWSS
jgi:probable F420-dependent oxidoreductase